MPARRQEGENQTGLPPGNEWSFGDHNQWLSPKRQDWRWEEVPGEGNGIVESLASGLHNLLVGNEWRFKGAYFSEGGRSGHIAFVFAHPTRTDIVITTYGGPDLTSQSPRMGDFLKDKKFRRTQTTKLPLNRDYSVNIDELLRGTNLVVAEDTLAAQFNLVIQNNRVYTQKGVAFLTFGLEDVKSRQATLRKGAQDVTRKLRALQDEKRRVKDLAVVTPTPLFKTAG